MSKLNKAIEDVQKFQTMFGGILDLAEALKEIPSVENHIAELKNQKDALIIDVENINAHAAELEKKNSDLILENAKIEQEAKEKAEAIHNEGILKGDSYVKAALLEIEADKAKMQEQKDEFNLQWSDAQSKLSTIRELIISESERLDKIKSEIAKIKEL
jgi:chromosome segregation ATPase